MFRAKPTADTTKGLEKTEAFTVRMREQGWRVAWRVQMQVDPNTPAAETGDKGFFLTDKTGAVTALSGSGRILWKKVLAGRSFAAPALVQGGYLALASVDGGVSLLRKENGELVWAVKRDARFQHKPLAGFKVKDVDTLLLVSQSDGVILCLSMLDGSLLWQSDPTNRFDGEPVMIGDRLAYGNCDGAVHVFDAKSGTLLGSVKIGENDQMAGGMLVSDGGVLFAGTRQGRLAAVDAWNMLSLAHAEVSATEAFLTPVRAFDGAVAMGSAEGVVSLWKLEGSALVSAGQVSFPRAIDGLDGQGGRLFVLSGGAVHVLDRIDATVCSMKLGDVVHGLLALSPNAAVCIADGAVVYLEGE